MKTKSLNSTEELKGFLETFSIYSLLKNSPKTIQTIQDYSENSNNQGLAVEELKKNCSEPFSECHNCQFKETISGIGDGCKINVSGEFPIQWTSLRALKKCPRGY